MVGAAVVMDAVVVVVVVNKGNEERPGESKKDVDSLEFCCETSDPLMSC